LRAKEISDIRWSMVTDAQDAVTDTIHLVNGASKGKRGGREIPMPKICVRLSLNCRRSSRLLLKSNHFQRTRYRHCPKRTLYCDLGFKRASAIAAAALSSPRPPSDASRMAAAYVTFSSWRGIQAWPRHSTTSSVVRMRNAASST
jgi:hypothetical protein